MKKILLILSLIILQLYQILYSENSRLDLLNQKIIELQSGINVLFIAIRPSYEDLSAIAYFRYELGAKSTTVFVTNGESLIEDKDIEHPSQFTANLRDEAYLANSYLNSYVYFLNFPDISALSDTNFIKNYWDYNKLLTEFDNLFKIFKPNIIILSKDFRYPDNSPLNNYLLKCLVELIKNKYTRGSPFILSYNEKGKHILFSVNKINPIQKCSYNNIGSIAQKHYNSQYDNLVFQLINYSPNYELVYPPQKANIFDLVSIIKRRVDSKIKLKVLNISKYILNNKNKIFSDPKINSAALSKIFKLMLDIDNNLKMGTLDEFNKVFLVRWKNILDEIRCILLDVKVVYEIDETVLTNSQVAHITFKSIYSRDINGVTEIIFPAINDGWIINETTQKQHPLVIDEAYRILTPQNLNYHLPRSIYGIHNNEHNYNFQFIIIHLNKEKEKSFIYKENIPIKFAPRFSIEIFNPVVYAQKEKNIVVRLTNNSRDGVSDYIFIDHPTVKTNKYKFRLNQKGATYYDTLILQWENIINQNEYLVPLTIGEVVVGNIMVKNFHINNQFTKKLYLFKNKNPSKLLNVLHFLGVNPIIKQDFLLSDIIENSIILINQNFLTNENINQFENLFKVLIEKNNHIIFFSQKTSIWNSFREINDFYLKPDCSVDIYSEVKLEISNQILEYPNKINENDFLNWIHKIGVNDVILREFKDIKTAIHSNGIPLLLEKSYNNGKYTYINLNLITQVYNINPVVYKILANLFSN